MYGKKRYGRWLLLLDISEQYLLEPSWVVQGRRSLGMYILGEDQKKD
jgi:hypothetical protein